MESVINTVCAKKPQFIDLPNAVRETEVAIGEKTAKIAFVTGLSNAKRLLERMANGEVRYDAIEVMACPGGCLNGGGQPRRDASQLNFSAPAERRAKALTKLAIET